MVRHTVGWTQDVQRGFFVQPTATLGRLLSMFLAWTLRSA